MDSTCLEESNKIGFTIVGTILYFLGILQVLLMKVRNIMKMPLDGFLSAHDRADCRSLAALCRSALSGVSGLGVGTNMERGTRGTHLGG